MRGWILSIIWGVSYIGWTRTSQRFSRTSGERDKFGGRLRKLLGVVYTRASFKPFECAKRSFCYFNQASVNRSILTIWYSFAIVESIEDELKTNGNSTYPCISSHSHGEVGRSICCYILVTIKVSLLKSKYLHGLRPCKANIIIILCYYQPLLLV